MRKVALVTTPPELTKGRIHKSIMAHLTKPTQYKIEDSNIALLGSDVRHQNQYH